VSPLGSVRRHPELVAGLLAIAGLAWWWTVKRMAGMDGGPGAALGTLGWFTISWAVMMAAMMLPSFAPTLGAYATHVRDRRPSRWLLFVAGYLLVWTAAGVFAYGAFELGKSVLGGEFGWSGGGRWLSVAVLVGAAAYELLPLKRRCLSRCRGQLAEPRSGWNYSRAGALALGARGGAWCFGCSWALMTALFALGVMGLTWMVAIAALVTLEKATPWPLAARLTTASVLAALAIGILLAPHQVPGLVIPGSGAMHAMKAMS
jgi:predicted metal-binding membrane protein